MVSELDAVQTAKLMLQQHGAREAWRMLIARAIDEHLTGNVEHRDITQQVLSALRMLSDGLASDEARH